MQRSVQQSVHQSVQQSVALVWATGGPMVLTVVGKTVCAPVVQQSVAAVCETVRCNCLVQQSVEKSGQAVDATICAAVGCSGRLQQSMQLSVHQLVACSVLQSTQRSAHLNSCISESITGLSAGQSCVLLREHDELPKRTRTPHGVSHNTIYSDALPLFPSLSCSHLTPDWHTRILHCMPLL